jgi:hypothetical protein
VTVFRRFVGYRRRAGAAARLSPGLANGWSMTAGAAAKSIFRTMMHFLSGMRHWRKLFTGPPVPRGRDHIFAIGANAEVATNAATTLTKRCLQVEDYFHFVPTTPTSQST